MVAGSILRRIAKAAARKNKKPTHRALQARSVRSARTTRTVRRMPQRTRPGAGVYVGAGSDFDPKGLSRELPRSRRRPHNPVATDQRKMIDEFDKVGHGREARDSLRRSQFKDHFSNIERIKDFRKNDNRFPDINNELVPGDISLRVFGGVGVFGASGLGFGSYFNQRRRRKRE